MAPLSTIVKTSLNKTNCLFYGAAILLGALIAVGTYQMEAIQRQSQHETTVLTYLDRIISRMDAVSGQLSTWGSVDMQQYQR